MKHPSRSLLLTPAIAILLACSSAGGGRAAPPRWHPVVLWQGADAFERVRTGRPDAADPRLQIVGVDQGGNVVLIHWSGGDARAEVIHRHPGELTGLLLADLDPSIPGEEIYVGGSEQGEEGGAVVQLAVTPDGTRVRRLWSGDAYVHSLEAIDAQHGRPRGLLVSTYAGQVLRLEPAAGDGSWSGGTLFADAPSDDRERPKIKDAAFLATSDGSPRHEALLAFKTGRLLHLDLDAPASARFLHDEAGGLSRVTADPDGGAWITGYAGRVLHFRRADGGGGGGFACDVLACEGADSGLRGLVAGRFPLPDGRVAPLALFGFHALCRALVPSEGAHDVVTLFHDIDRGHCIEAADLVPGNDADELLLAGYSRRIVALVAERGAPRDGR